MAENFFVLFFKVIFKAFNRHLSMPFFNIFETVFAFATTFSTAPSISAFVASQFTCTL